MKPTVFAYSDPTYVVACISEDRQEMSYMTFPIEPLAVILVILIPLDETILPTEEDALTFVADSLYDCITFPTFPVAVELVMSIEYCGRIATLSHVILSFDLKDPVLVEAKTPLKGIGVNIVPRDVDVDAPVIDVLYDNLFTRLSHAILSFDLKDPVLVVAVTLVNGTGARTTPTPPVEELAVIATVYTGRLIIPSHETTAFEDNFYLLQCRQLDLCSDSGSFNRK